MSEQKSKTPAQRRMDDLDREAEALLKAGASGEEFEALRRRGWRSLSQREKSSLKPCPSDCGVCFPTPSSVRRRGT